MTELYILSPAKNFLLFSQRYHLAVDIAPLIKDSYSDMSFYSTTLSIRQAMVDSHALFATLVALAAILTGVTAADLNDNSIAALSASDAQFASQVDASCGGSPCPDGSYGPIHMDNPGDYSLMLSFGRCCPYLGSAVCCGGGRCCPPGQSCCSTGKCCPYPVGSGAGCCSSGNKCCPGG